MTIQELRAPKVNEIATWLKAHQEAGCTAQDFGGFIQGGGCTCVPQRMFLYDLMYHEPIQEETDALTSGHVPDFLQLEASPQ